MSSSHFASNDGAPLPGSSDQDQCGGPGLSVRSNPPNGRVPASDQGSSSVVSPRGASASGDLDSSGMDTPEPGREATGQSASAVVIQRHLLESAVPRRVGPRAEQPFLSLRLREVVEAGDAMAEAECSAILARRLAASGAELDQATKLARRSLQLRDDLGVREELAGWLAGLAEPAMAAALLRPMAEGQLGERAARLLTRAAVLFARAGDARSAAEALAEAGRRDPLDPTAPELYAAVGAWAPEMLAPEQVAQGYLEGSLRRDALGEGAAAFEDLLRAFEAAPGFSPVAERLAAALRHRGRAAAADEVRREHARARGGDAAALHRLRAAEAFADESYACALGAALDAGWDAHWDLPGARRALELESRRPEQVSLDEILERVGLHDILAARLELQSEELDGPARSTTLIPLALLLEGPLAAPDRAACVWVDALVSDPGATAALQHVRAYAGSLRDQSPLIEALLRVTAVPLDSYDERRVHCIRELAALAEQRLPDPTLAVWALRRLRDVGRHRETGLSNEEVAAVEARTADRMRQQDELLTELCASLEQLTGSARLTVLRRLAALLRSRPERMETYLSVLEELILLAPSERIWLGMLERALERTGQQAELAILYARLTEAQLAYPDREQLLLRWSSLLRRRGQAAAAIACLAPLLEDGVPVGAAWAIVLCMAARSGLVVERAQAWRRWSSRVAAPVRSVIQAAASQWLLAAGETPEALAAADHALAADPSQARGLAARAEVALRAPERASTSVLERAIGVLVPRAAMCRRLAVAYDELGEPELALAWCQRWIALRPGDPEAIAVLLAKVEAGGDARRLSDTLGWVLAQPQPLPRMAGLVTRGLRALLVRDPQRAAALARRTLDVVGPRIDEVRGVLMDVADSTGEAGFAIAVIERYLVAGAPGAERPIVLLDLAERRLRTGDTDGAARTLCRALAEGADAAAVLAQLEHALPARGSDGEVWLLQARAEALSASPGAQLARTALAWREYGAALWDLVGDSSGAIGAWEHAASLDREHGVERAAADLVAFAGAEIASQTLESIAGRRQEKAEAARFLGMAGALAVEAGDSNRGFDLAVRAVELDASEADALVLAERAVKDTDYDVLERLYQLASAATSEPFGARAVHHRAARYWERRGLPGRALEHARRAFQSAPASGVSLGLLVQLAERVGEAAELLGAVALVADRHPDMGSDAEWLLRASRQASSRDEGRRLRVELLFHALALQSGLETLTELSNALAALVASVPSEREGAELRLSRALSETHWPEDGAARARLALGFAHAAWGGLESEPVAVRALLTAAVADPAQSGFAAFIPMAGRLVSAKADSLQLVAEVQRLLDGAAVGVGGELVALVASLGESLDEPGLAARFAFELARREPSNLELAIRAEALARRSGDSALLEAIQAALPGVERLAAVIETAELAERGSEHAVAAAAWEDLLSTPGLAEAQRRLATDRVSVLYRTLGYQEKLEALLLRELELPALDPERHLTVLLALPAQCASQGQVARALELLEPQLASHPTSPALLSEVAKLARTMDRLELLIDVLNRQCGIVQDPAERQTILEELGALLEAQGAPSAMTCWRELLLLRPDHPDALSVLERDAEAHGDWELVVELLGRRAAAVSTVEEVRRLRMRRALVLEQRLAAPDAARSELEQLRADTGDHRSVIYVLADLEQRLGNTGRAGTLWWQATEYAQDDVEAAQLARRACECFLASGDTDAARAVLEGMESRAVNLPRELRVEVERKAGDPLALADALEEWAEDADETPERCAALLIEAALATEQGGDLAGALARARAAVRLVPGLALAQLTARLLEYRARGTGSPQEARATLAELRSIEGKLTPEEAELRAFLTAEALDVTLGGGAGLRELTRACQECGHLPLIDLGLAERLAAADDPAKSLPLFEVVLRSDLRGVRSAGRVAMAAARVAIRAGDPGRAGAFLEQAIRDPRLHSEVLDLRASLAELPGTAEESYTIPLVRRASQDVFRGIDTPVSDAPRTSRTADSPPATHLPDTARSADDVPLSPAHNGRGIAVEVVVGERTRASRPVLSVEVIDWPRRSQSPSGSSLATEPLATPSVPASSGAPFERPDSPGPATPSLQVPAEFRSPFSASAFAWGPPSSAPGHGGAPLAHEPDPAVGSTPSVRLQVPRAVHRELPSSPGWTAPSRKPASSWPPVVPADTLEEQLLNALDLGAIEAGLELAEKIRPDVGRRSDRVNLLRRLHWLQPGDPQLLDQLYEAAMADRSVAYALALDHARHVFGDASVRVSAPPLAAQPEEPERLRALIARDTSNPVGEALAIVWEGAGHVFRREPSSYGVTGLERVGIGAPTVLSRVYTLAARALGINAPLFQRRAYGEPNFSVLLLAPSAILLTGEVRRDSPQLAYHVGTQLAGTLPEHVMLLGADKSQVEALLQALALAFGPPMESSTPIANVAKLAETLWERIPARAQRRLREICNCPDVLDFKTAVAAARRAGRRAGLLVCGDLGVAVEEVAAEVGFPSAELLVPGGLSAACAARPEIADVVRVATSPEYAEARWRTSRPRPH